MLRKLLVCTLILTFVFSSLALAQPATGEMTVIAKIAAVENFLYGAEQTGALVDRVAKVEKDIYGLETKAALVTKLDNIYQYTHQSTSLEPSFLVKLNAVEWTLTHTVTVQPAKERLENLERTLLGNVATGAFDDRTNQLVKLAFGNGHVQTTTASIAADTLVKIKIITPLDSRKSRVGDTVLFEAADDIYVDGVLVVAKGAHGTGKLLKVHPSKNFGRDAKLEVSFNTIDAIDGTIVDTFLGDKAKEETKSLAKAAGATVAGLALLGPIGVVGGAFVNGQEVIIPAGSEMYIQTKTEANITGILIK